MMNINRIFSALFLTAVLGLSSCGGSEPEQNKKPKDPVISVSVPEAGFVVVNGGGSFTASYSVENPTDDGRLTVTASAEWISDIQVNVSNVTLNVEPNPGDERSAELKFSYPGAQTVNVNLRQLAAGEEIAISESAVEVECGESSLEIIVTSDRDWTLSGGESWVTASAEAGKSGDKVVFSVESNDDTNSREATFTFTCNTKTATLVITQSGKDVLASIKDNTLKSLLLAAADTDGDGKISLAEAAAVKSLEYKVTEASDLPIMTLEGLEYFTGLERIVLQGNEFTEINLSGNTALTYLDLSSNTYLETVNVKGCSALTAIYVPFDKALQTVDLEGCTSLVTVTGYASGLTSLDVKDCSKLETLTVYSTNIQTLDVSMCPALKVFNAGGSALTSVTLPENSVIETLSLSESSKLTSLDLSKLPALKSLSIGSSAIAVLYLAKCPLLETLTMDFCKKITSIDVSKNLHLKSISAMLSGLVKVTMFEGQWEDIQAKCNGISKSMITTVAIDYPEDCSAVITDSGLRNYVISKYDTDGDGKISGSEAEKVTEISYSEKGLTSFSNFVYFRHIQKLNLSNNALESIDLGPFASTLEELDLSHNSLTELSLSGVKVLKTMDISYNSLTACTGFTGMDLSSTLENVNASHNKLKSFQCSYAKSLKNVNLSYNELTTCNLEYCSAIVDLNVSNNHLTEDTNSFVRPFTFTSLMSIDVSNNDFILMESDVTWTDKWTGLISFICSGCAKLQSLDLSPIESIKVVEAKDCPRLEYIYLSSSANPQVAKDSTTEIKRK